MLFAFEIMYQCKKCIEFNLIDRFKLKNIETIALTMSTSNELIKQIKKHFI
jgi:hypothetical protein